MTHYFVVDTNILLNGITELEKFNLVITADVSRELDKLKSKGNSEQKFQAREAIRFIEKNEDRFKFDSRDYKWDLNDIFDHEYVDNKLLKCCVENGYGIVTGDIILRIKARQFGVDVGEFDDYNDDYKGYREVRMTKKEYDNLFNIDTDYFRGMLENEYFIVRDANCFDNDNPKHFGAWKLSEGSLLEIKDRGFSTNQFGSFKPYDIYQKCALDSLRNNKVTMIKGSAGTGKSLIALNYAFHQIEKGKISKVIFFVNPIASKNSAKLGFYPGNRNEKLLDSSVGSMLSSKFGDKQAIEDLISTGIVMLLPFADIRGFDTTGMNAIVHIIEAQNLDKELMKLAIQRVGEDSKLIIDGDYHTQVDSDAFTGSKNGMRRVSEVFRGEQYYGEVELPIVHRSEIARRAELM